MQPSEKTEIEGPARPGFTLIELLMVVAIIALLVAILVPALEQARKQAKDMLCATNQRQIAVAWQMYLSDNDCTFPPTGGNIQLLYGGRQPATVTTMSVRPLNPYLSMQLQNQEWAEVFRCPVERPIRGGSADGYRLYDYAGNCYMFNYYLHHPWEYNEYGVPKFSTDEPFHLGDVEFAHSLVLLIGDFQWYYTAPGSIYDAQFHSPFDYMNLAFLDGHVAFMRVYRPDEVAAGEIPEYRIDPCREDDK